MTEQVRRATRLVEIERLLRKRPAGWTAAELSRALGYSARTIQRDLAALESEIGVPLLSEGRRYRIMPGAHPLLPVRFTLQEARALYLASRLFLRYADERDPDGISALEKLADALPEPVSAQVASTAARLRGRPERRTQGDVLRKLTECWASLRTATIQYRSQSAAGVRTTALDPYLLEPSTTGAATYVVGFSHEHGALRTFKIDRILSAIPTAETFEPPDVDEIMDSLARSWGVVFGDDAYAVTVDFTAAVAKRVAETNWHPSQALTPLGDGGLRLQLTLPSLLEFIPWIRSWGPEAVVVAPAELREPVAASLREAALRYGAPAS